MTRQHTAPVVVGLDGAARTLRQLPVGGTVDRRVDEAFLQALVASSPGVLPVSDIDADFEGAVHLCREFRTPAGPIDNLLVTPTGRPIVVECKLWSNPESRREVVGQILDYAKELIRFSCADVQRGVNSRNGSKGDSVFEAVRAVHPDVNQISFNDSLTRNLRKGRFLLLIVGDGIREGVESIAEYVDKHANSHFTLGLVELPIFALSDTERLVAPRVVAHTQIIRRTVIELPEGLAVAADDDERSDVDSTPTELETFWAEFLSSLKLDDPDQPIPRPANRGNLTFSLPIPGSSGWLTVFRLAAKSHLGLFYGYRIGTIGEEDARRLHADGDELIEQLGTATFFEGNGKVSLDDHITVSSFDDPASRAEALAWLRQQTNEFVNALRPRVRAIVNEIGGS